MEKWESSRFQTGTKNVNWNLHPSIVTFQVSMKKSDVELVPWTLPISSLEHVVNWVVKRLKLLGKVQHQKRKSHMRPGERRPCIRGKCRSLRAWAKGELHAGNVGTWFEMERTEWKIFSRGSRLTFAGGWVGDRPAAAGAAPRPVSAARRGTRAPSSSRGPSDWSRSAPPPGGSAPVRSTSQSFTTNPAVFHLGGPRDAFVSCFNIFPFVGFETGKGGGGDMVDELTRIHRTSPLPGNRFWLGLHDLRGQIMRLQNSQGYFRANRVHLSNHRPDAWAEASGQVHSSNQTGRTILAPSKNSWRRVSTHAAKAASHRNQGQISLSDFSRFVFGKRLKSKAPVDWPWSRNWWWEIKPEL